MYTSSSGMGLSRAFARTVKHELERRTNMRKIWVKAWMTLDGVFDAETMDQWWNPYDSAERQKYILEGYSRGDVYLLGRTTYEMLWPFWSTQTNDDDGPGPILNRMKKYVVSTTLKIAPWKESTIITGNMLGSWPTLVNRGWMRFEKTCLELRPKRLWQDNPIISLKMAMTERSE